GFQLIDGKVVPIDPSVPVAPSPDFSKPTAEDLQEVLELGGGIAVSDVIETSRSKDDDAWPSITKGQPLTDAEILILASEGGTVWGQKIREIAGKHGIDPKDLLSIMRFETGGSFSASVANPESGATGLIQFTAPVAKELGTTLAELAQMSREEQLVYVDRYLDMRKKPPFNLPERGASLDDLYMAVLYPAAIGKESSFVLFRSGERAYDQNKGLDSNNDGTITKGEAVARVRKYQSRQEPTAQPPDEPAPINAELPLVDKMSEYVAAKDATEPASVVTGKEPTSEKAVLELPSLAPGFEPDEYATPLGAETNVGRASSEYQIREMITNATRISKQLEENDETKLEYLSRERKLRNEEWILNS
ncbi:uncharacterized protein METZ01_LOCUS318132, partial [marine metagenome]